MSSAETNSKEEKAPNWLIENISEASKNASKIYLLYLGSLAYVVLTVVGTTDRQIILNEKVRLPIVNLDVSVNGFFILCPVILLIVFIYFQLYLNRLIGLIRELRSDYPPVPQRRLYPSMLNIAEYPEPGPVGEFQVMAAKFTMWTSLPIVLNLIAFWYIRKHEPIWSYVVGILSILGTILLLWFWYVYDPHQWRKTKRWLIVNSLAVFFVIGFEIFLLAFLIPCAREGGRYKWLKPFVCVDLSYQKLITEPEKDKAYEGLFWGNFSNAHLEGANLTNAILKRANLEDARLQKAMMYKAVLQGAILSKANLQEAKLLYANLQEANLLQAYLRGADLQSANLQGAEFLKADLQETNLWRANLQEAKLLYANLRGADLREANLDGANLMGTDLIGVNNLNMEQLSKTKTLYKAKLGTEILIKIEKDYPHLLEKPKEEKPKAGTNSK